MIAFKTITATLAAASLVVASSAQAADAPAAPDAPDVPGGEMTCLVVTFLAASAAKTVAEKSKSDGERQAVQQIGEGYQLDGQWYLARISTWPKEARTGKNFSAAFDTVKTFSKDDMGKVLKTCDDWVKKNREETLNQLKPS